MMLRVVPQKEPAQGLVEVVEDHSRGDRETAAECEAEEEEGEGAEEGGDPFEQTSK